MVSGERFKCWMEFGIRVEETRPLRMVLGSNHASWSGGETCRTGRRDVSGTRQFRRSLPTQSELSFIWPISAHTDWALPGFLQPVLAVRLRRLPVHCGADRAVHWRFEDGRVLLFASPCAGVTVVSRAADTRCVAVCAGPIVAVPLPLRHSPAHSRRSYPAPAFADFHQRLAGRTPLLVMTVYVRWSDVTVIYVMIRSLCCRAWWLTVKITVEYFWRYLN